MWIIPSFRLTIREGEGYFRYYKHQPGWGTLQIGHIQFDYYGITPVRVALALAVVALLWRLT